MHACLHHRPATTTRPFLTGVLVVLTLLSLPTAMIWAGTFALGGADGSFETGLGGMVTAGDVHLVPSVGVLRPTQGGQAAFLTTTPDAGAALTDADVSLLRLEQLTIPAAMAQLRLDYVFLTHEFTPSKLNDRFTVSLVLVNPTGEETLLQVDTFAPIYPAPWTGYATQTGFRTLVADVSASAGTGDEVTLELRLTDVGDGRGDSAVLLDNLQFTAAGEPQACANYTYIAVNPGAPLFLDGSCSTDTNDTIVEYRWELGDGTVRIGRFVEHTYTADGVYQATLTVTDAAGQTSVATFLVVVGVINHAPQIVSVPRVSAAAHTPYRYAVVAEDPERLFGDRLTFALVDGPAGMDIDPVSGVVTWAPSADIPQQHAVTVQVTDSLGLSDTQTFTVVVGPEVYIVAADDAGHLYAARSNGDGTFADYHLVAGGTGSNTEGVAMADFDGDGDFDVVSGHSGSASLSVYYYERQGTRFAAPVLLGTVGDPATSAGNWLLDMAAADVTNNGSMDFVVNGNAAHSWLFLHQGQLTFGQETFVRTDFETDEGAWGEAACQTGFARDATTAHSGTRSMRVYATGSPSCLHLQIRPANWDLHQGPTLTFAYRIPPGVPVGLSVLVGGSGRLFLGGSPAGLSDGVSAGVRVANLIDDDTWRTVTIDLYDAIRQQWPEATGQIIAFAWWTNANAAADAQFWFDDFQVTRRTYVSGFQTSLLPNTGGVGRGMDAADVHGDGHIDLARGHCCDGLVSLYTGDGTGNFTTAVVADAGADPYGVALADFDNDGRIDLMANADSSGTAWFFQGNGDGTFQPGVSVASLDTHDWSAYSVYDFDHDGNQDLVVVRWSGRQVWYYPGNGDATFGVPVLLGTTLDTALGIAAPAGWVIGQPLSVVTLEPDTIQVGHTVTFDASGSVDDGTIVGYDWLFNDGATASGPVVSHTFASEGVSVVTVTVTDDEGRRDRHTLRVTVRGAPPVANAGGPYTVGEAAAIDGGWPITVDGSASTDAETSLVSYVWDFDASDGLAVEATGVTPQHTYTAPGIYTVTLTVTDEAQQSHSATTTVTVQVGAPPVAVLTGPTVVDETFASGGHWHVPFDAGGSTDDVGIAAYVWEFGDGATGSGVAPTHAYSTPGTYTVTLTVTDRAGQQATTTFTVVIAANAPPVADAGGPYLLAPDHQVQFVGSASSDDVAIARYRWDFGDGTSSLEVNPRHIYIAPGTYAVTLTVTDHALQSATATTMVQVSRVGLVDSTGVTGDGQTLQITGIVSAQITNADTVVMGAFMVTFFDDTDGNGRFEAAVDTILGSTAQASLPAGATRLVSAAVAGPVSFRDAPIHAFVDTGEVAAASEVTNYGHSGQACTFVPPVGAFSPHLEWQWTGGTTAPTSQQVMMTPAVIDLTADGVPEVVFTSFSGGNYHTQGHLRAISGQDGSAIFTVTDPTVALRPGGNLAVGDLDADGQVEILAVDESSDRIIAFAHDGTFLWRSPVVPGGIDFGGPALADLDRDGTPEIIVGATVLNADGTLRWSGTQGRGASYAGPLSLVANLDLQGDPEVLAGNTAYRADGSIYWHTSSVADGLNAVGNFDADPFPEVVLVTNGLVYLLAHDGAIQWGPVALPGGGLGGPPTVADVDADGAPEIGVAGSTAYAVFEADGSLKWQQPVQDVSSQITGSSVFDFDGDGAAEIIYSDEVTLRIYRGRDGAVLWNTPSPSGTLYELPVIVDVDADGNAEIVMVSNNYYIPGSTGIQVYGDATDRWVPTRPLWNQHTYHVTNIHDDGAIPPDEAPSWLGHNTYRRNLRTAGQIAAAPDLTASRVRIVGDAAAWHLTARIGNGGALAAPAGVPIAFYDGDPHTAGTLLGMVVLATALAPGGFEDVSLTVHAETLDTIRVMADDAGTPTGLVNECREDNNLHDSGLRALANQPPLAAAGGPYSATEGVALALDGTGSSDPDGDPLTYAWDLDADGVFDDATGATPTVTFPDQGAFTVALHVSDGTEGSTDTAVITVSNVAPTVTVALEDTATEGSALTGSGSLSDSGADSWTATVDYGDGTGVQPLTLQPDQSFTLDHTYADDGTYTVTVAVSDDDGGVGTNTAVVTVTNVAPAINAGLEATLAEGSTFVQAGSFSDPGADAWTATVDYGDGSGVQPLTLQVDQTFSLSHTYADDGSYPVTVTVTDDDAGGGSATLVVTVTNVTPTVVTGADATLGEGSALVQAGAFTDPGTNTWSATVDYGDGSGVQVLTLLPDQTFTLQHTYANDGVYTVTVRITDADGAVGSATLTVSVTNVAPTAHAGTDQSVDEGQLVTLDGSGSHDPGADPVSFQWQQLAGPTVVLDMGDPVSPTFTAPTVPAGGATLTFALTVSDGVASSTPAVVNITITNVNNPPHADAGAAQTVQEDRLVTLDGTGSFDADNEPLNSSWTQTSGPLVVLSDPAAEQPSFTAPLVDPAGVSLGFLLTVSDGLDSASASTTVQVANVNQAPVAHAGGAQTVNEASGVTLDGTASSDPDGDALSSSWTQTSGPPVTLDDATVAQPSFTAPLVPPGGATLVFELTVSDGVLSSGAASVTITVRNINDPPACTLAQAHPDTLWPPNHTLIGVGVGNVTDPDNEVVAITVTAVTQDEPTNGLGDGNTSPDAVLQGAEVLLRRERAGGGNGRVYALTFQADDGFHAPCTGTVWVCVPHNKQETCVDDGQLYDAIQP